MFLYILHVKLKYVLVLHLVQVVLLFLPRPVKKNIVIRKTVTASEAMCNVAQHGIQKKCKVLTLTRVPGIMTCWAPVLSSNPPAI